MPEARVQGWAFFLRWLPTICFKIAWKNVASHVAWFWVVSYHLGSWVKWVHNFYQFSTELYQKTNDLQNSTASLWPGCHGCGLFSCEKPGCNERHGQALEKWPVEMIERMLPRHLQLIGAAWLWLGLLGWWVDNLCRFGKKFCGKSTNIAIEILWPTSKICEITLYTFGYNEGCFSSSHAIPQARNFSHWVVVRRIGCDSLGCSTTNGLTPPSFLKNGSYIVDDFYYTNSKL